MGAILNMIWPRKRSRFATQKRRPGLFFGPVFRPQTRARKTNTQQLYFTAEKSLRIALARWLSLAAPFFDLALYRQTQRPIASIGSNRTLTPQSADAGPQQAYTGHTNAQYSVCIYIYIFIIILYIYISIYGNPKKTTLSQELHVYMYSYIMCVCPVFRQVTTNGWRATASDEDSTVWGRAALSQILKEYQKEWLWWSHVEPKYATWNPSFARSVQVIFPAGTEVADVGTASSADRSLLLGQFWRKDGGLDRFHGTVSP